MHKTLYKTGFIAYALLLIMSALFYKERTIFLDAACHLFYILVSDDFAIQHNRFGAVVTQIFPVIGSKTGMSLKGTLMLYSTGITFYYFLCYIICGSVLKQYGLALVILLLSTLFATDTFFWPLSELLQGCTMLLVMFAVLNTTMHAVLKYSVVLALTITLAFIHPLIIFPASFIFMYLLVSGQSNISNRALLICFALFIITYIIKTIFFKPPYEAKATAGLGKTLLDLIPQYFELYSVKKFIADCSGKFILIPVFLATTTAFYIIKRKWLLLGLYLISVFGFISLINLSYHYSEVPSFYIENLYLPISIFLATPVVFELLPAINNNKLAVVLVLVLTLSGVYRMYKVQDLYTARLNWVRNFLTLHPNEKIIMHERHAPMDTLMMSWGTSYEFWLLSTVEQGKTASVAISKNIDSLIPPPNKPKSFITEYNGYPYAMLPGKYFIFKDTVSEYRVIK